VIRPGAIVPPPVILDPTSIDLERVIADRAAIMAVNPHRHEFSLLDAVVYFDREQGLVVGYYDVRPDAWWARGHIPQRPLLPGVLMIEIAAQLASYVSHAVLGNKRFLGFSAVDDVKFRGTVQPPCRFVIVGKAREVRPRRTICDAQGFVDGTMVFQAVITGMPI